MIYIQTFKPQNTLVHLAAILVIFIWGITFVSTKVLLNNGLNPASIFFYRFILGYIGILFFSYKSSLLAKSVKDELMFMLVGILGGSLYYFTENIALDMTSTSNVALIVCMNPLLTAILLHVFSKNQRMSKNLLLGSLLAFIGVSLVIFNGKFNFNITIIGELIAFMVAISWSFYTLLLKHMGDKYSSLFITRKVLFYGIVTIIPAFMWEPLVVDWAIFATPIVWLNMLFLGLGASLFCYFTWSRAIRALGAVKASNYIYFMPIVTLITSALIINETITYTALIGAILIILGVYISEKQSLIFKRKK